MDDFDHTNGSPAPPKTGRRRRPRLHLRLEAGRSPLEHWHFDDPRVVRIGNDSKSSVWLYDPEAGPSRLYFRRRRGHLELLVHPQARGFLTVEGRPLPFDTMAQTGLLTRRGGASALPLNEGSAGGLIVGSTRMQFHVTAYERPALPWFREKARLLWRDLPKLFTVFLVLSALLHGYFLAFLRSLDPLPPPTIYEVTQRAARFAMSEREYSDIRLRDPSRVRTRPAPGIAEQAPPTGISETALRGLLAAVTTDRAGAKASPFSNLFTRNPLGGAMSDKLLSRSIDRLLSAPRIGGGSDLTRAGTAAEVRTGDLPVSDYSAESLSKDLSGPRVARLSERPESVRGAGIDHEALERFVTSRTAELQDCYERALTRVADLTGRMVVEISILTSGRARNARVVGGNIEDAGMRRCVLSRMETWIYPAQEADTGPIRFPLVFTRVSGRG